MMTPPEEWTDKRLDDLNRRVDEGFKRVDEGFKETREEFRALRTQMADQFSAQQRMTVQLFGGMFATMLIGFLGVVATILVHG